LYLNVLMICQTLVYIGTRLKRISFIHIIPIWFISVAKLNEHIRAHISKPGFQERIQRRMKRAIERKFTSDFIKQEALKQGIDIDVLREIHFKNSHSDFSNSSSLVSRDDNASGAFELCMTTDAGKIDGTVTKLLGGIRAFNKGEFETYLVKEFNFQKGNPLKDLCIGAK
jgi:hypothetical protein